MELKHNSFYIKSDTLSIPLESLWRVNYKIVLPNDIWFNFCWRCANQPEKKSLLVFQYSHSNNFLHFLLLTVNTQRDLSSLTPSLSLSTVSLTTSTTRPSVGTSTNGTGPLGEPARIAPWSWGASRCCFPAALTSSPGSSSSAALPRRPGKVSSSAS